MRDFYPEDFNAREAVFDAWHTAARLGGFESYDAPVVETMELLERKAGEEIADQIYTFEDKGGNRLALRPELTPSLARMIIARQGGLAFPIKWSAIAQCFRYERMQRGRKREHYQWNLDVVGEASLMAEVEVIGTAVAAMERLGLTADDFKVRVGSRALLSALIEHSGVDANACFMALDKRGKIEDKVVAEMLEQKGCLSSDEIDRIFRLLALESLAEIKQALEGRGAEAVAQLNELFALAAAMGLGDYLVFDLGIVRGLGYYTGVVFEAFDTAGKFRAIFGGGRYDNLLSSLGGQTMPCVGLGFGDVVVMELLADLKKTPATRTAIDCAIGYMDDSACRATALAAARALRGVGLSCDLGLHPEKPKKFFSRADRGGARHGLLIGQNEVDSGQFKVKRMESGESIEATPDTLAAVLRLSVK